MTSRKSIVCRNHPAVLGENNANLPRIVSIVAEAFQHEALSVTSEVGVRLLNIARLVRVTSLHSIAFCRELDVMLIRNKCKQSLFCYNSCLCGTRNWWNKLASYSD